MFNNHLFNLYSNRYILRTAGVIFLLVFFLCGSAHAYIGPGAGFAVMGSFFTVFFAILSAMVTLLIWPVRFMIRMIRRRYAFAKSRIKKFVIVGLDGLDPILTEKYMNEKKLPNLSRLRDQGSFKQLATTTPPISPVAWSSFQICANPGKHNIYDFLTRDPRIYHPVLSSVSIRPPVKTLRIGKYCLPLSRPDIRLLRRGKPFWTILGEHGIFSNIIRVPITFPPEKFQGISLSAMCVPDLRGTQGTFSFYTTKPPSGDDRTGGEMFHIQKNGSTLRACLIGPENPFKKDANALKANFTLRVLNQERADIKLNSASYELKKNVYSEWVTVSFKAAPGLSVSGICRFLLKSTHPDVELYVTPININPEKPAMKISHPPVYAAYFAKRIGPYATLGLAEDTWALNEKVLDDEAFLAQAIGIEKEREDMFFDTLGKVKHGLCVCVFDGTDRIQHTFWRHLDGSHPANAVYPRKPSSLEASNAIEDVYRRMDQLVGKTMSRCNDKDTILMIISDHGFTSFRYGVDLNRWLEENGYLHVKDNARDRKYLAAIDWIKTRAYSVGLAGIFLNLKGRESQGIVDSGEEAAALRNDIAQKLATLVHPADGNRAIENVYNALEIYNGPYKSEAPDLLIGYRPGFRASWETAVGKVTGAIFHDNTKAWSGDHCVDASFVPGVLFCNKPVLSRQAGIMDVGPTVLDLFGVQVPGYMDGKPLKLKID